jgi:site-specific DNA-methyltransferase (adenine-specific)
VSVQLIQGDCLEVMRTLPDGCVDAVITDPPYGIGYQMHAPSKQTNGHRKTNHSFGLDELSTIWIKEAYRVLRQDTCAYVFTRWDVLPTWQSALHDAGFVIVQHLIWDKSHWGAGDLRYYGSQTESILFCRKGNPELFWRQRRGNVYKTVSRAFLPEQSDLHPTQKPESLMRIFVTDSTRAGATILDPFMGSGTTGVACVKTGRNFIGIELDEGYFRIAEKRITEAQYQLPLLEIA